MSDTRDLVDALISGDSIAIEDTFNSVMNDKISVELDSARDFIAQNMFKTQQETVEQEEQE
jgi:hypothetical protein